MASHIITILVEGDELEFTCLASDTVRSLKDRITEQEFMATSSQTLYCGLMRLEREEEELVVQELLQPRIFLEFPLAGGVALRQIRVDQDSWVIVGSRTDFQCMKISANTLENIRLPDGVFGIVTHVEGARNGEKRYTVRRFQGAGEGRLELRTREGRVEVYLGEEQLEGELMAYDERERNAALAIEAAVTAARLTAIRDDLRAAVSGFLFTGLATELAHALDRDLGKRYTAWFDTNGGKTLRQKVSIQREVCFRTQGRHLMGLWRAQLGSRATMDAMVDALRKLHQMALVEEICSL